MSRIKNFHHVPPATRLTALQKRVANIKQVPAEIAQLVATATEAVAAIPTKIVVGQPATLIPDAKAAAHAALDTAFTTLDEMHDQAQLKWANLLWAKVAQTAINLPGRVSDLVNRPNYQNLSQRYPAMADMVNFAQLKAASAAEFTGKKVNVRGLSTGAAKARKAEVYRDYVRRARSYVDLTWDVFRALKIIEKAMRNVENNPQIATLMLIPDFMKTQETATKAVGAARRAQTEKDFDEICRLARVAAQALGELHVSFTTNGGPDASILFDGTVGAKLDAAEVKLGDLILMTDAQIIDLDGIGPVALDLIREVVREPEEEPELTLEATLLASAATNGAAPDSIGAQVGAS